MKRFGCLVTLTLVLSFILVGCGERGGGVVSLNGQTMGTTYSVKYVPLDTQQMSASHTQSMIDDLLIDINQLMSTYIPDSELSLLNQAPAGIAFPVSAATQYVLQEALRLNALSNEKLDVTVGPLVNTWGFGPDQRATQIPTAEQLAQMTPYIGIDKFMLANNQVIKAHAKVYIDLSTIAKGYAVDQIAEQMKNNGIDNFLVEIGGEMRASGTKPDNVSWYIAIEKPLTGARAIQRIVSIGDNAIASSGDYRNYFEDNGVRYSHLIDPTTGFPIQHNLVAVSVVTPTAIEADGLATALMIMGLEEGKALAEREGIAALFVTKEGEEYVEYQTNRFIEKVKVIE